MLTQKPTLLIVTEWRTPLGEVETFVEGLVSQLRDAFEIVLAVRLHERNELPVMAAGCTLHHFRSSRQLKTIIKQYRPSLIHFQQSTQLALAVAGHRQHPSMLVTLHYLPFSGQPDHSPFKPHPWADLRQLSRLANVVAPDPEIYHLAVSNGVVMSGHIISGGVDTSRYRPGSARDARNELGLSAEPKLLLYTGHPDDPQFSRLVHTLAGLPLELPAAIIAAELPPHHALAPVISGLITRGRFYNLPAISRDDERHPMIYQAANLFITPSLISESVLPTLEAMASGLPVVTPGQLPSSLTEITNHPALERAFGEANRRQALKLDIKASAAAYSGLYRGLIS